MLDTDTLRQLYLDLLKSSLGDFLYDFDGRYSRQQQSPFSYNDTRTGRRHTIRDYSELKENGLTGSMIAHTLIGRKRMDQLQQAIETILSENIPGDLIETGVLRGGACILMRGVLKAWGNTERRVWVADSFDGFHPDDLVHLKAAGMRTPDLDKSWVASLEEVQRNFERYQLLDEQVCFLKGWFQDSLAPAPIHNLAILRLDGDLYQATAVALEVLYPKLSAGGFVIVDDYYAFEDCRRAVREYRQAHQIETPLIRVDPACVYWRK